MLIPLHEDDLAAILQDAAEDDCAGMPPSKYTDQARAVLHHLLRLGVGVPDPVGVPEIADRTNTTRSSVDTWRERHAFPAPRWTLGGRPAWEWDDVLAWGRETGRVRDGDRWAKLRRTAEVTS